MCCSPRRPKCNDRGRNPVSPMLDEGLHQGLHGRSKHPADMTLSVHHDREPFLSSLTSIEACDGVTNAHALDLDTPARSASRGSAPLAGPRVLSFCRLLLRNAQVNSLLTAAGANSGATAETPASLALSRARATAQRNSAKATECEFQQPMWGGVPPLFYRRLVSHQAPGLER